MNRRGQAHGQRFAKADYYECDWYYEESTDGKGKGNGSSSGGETPTRCLPGGNELQGV